MSTPKTVLAWHFRRANGTTYQLKTPEVVGKRYSVTGKIVPCANGLHGSVRPLHALEYGNSETAMICRTEHSGTLVREGNKLASRHRTVLWQADCTAVLHEFGCLCAEQSFEVIRKTGQIVDTRSIAAVNAKRSWLRGEISSKELDAARAAAWAAARDAARDAARAAAWAAARDAARDAQNTLLETMLLALAPVKVATLTPDDYPAQACQKPGCAQLALDGGVWCLEHKETRS